MNVRKTALIFLLSVLSFSVSWAVPTLINYEGRLADPSGSALSGLYNMRFTITSDSAGSTAVWGPETHSGVSVEGGVFSVLLGQTIPFTTAEVAGNDLYLKVEVASPPTSTTNYETLTPHSRIVSVAYALRAARADSLPADINIVTSGNVSAATFSGDGSGLTGVPAATLPSDINISTTGVVTAAAFHGDGTYLTGLPGGGDITAVIAGPGLTGGATTGAATLNAAYDGATIGLSGANSLEVVNNGITSAKLAADIDITTSGSISAASLVGTHYGDGSQLSGITADTASFAGLAGTASSTAYSVLAGTASTAASATTADSTAYATLAGTASIAATVSDYAITSTQIATSAVTAEKLAVNAAVLTFAEEGQSRLAGNVDLREGTNITLTQTGQTIEITSTASGGSVASVDSGTGLTGGPITGSGTISATYGGSGGDWGTADTLARSDHLHDADYVELSGDAMTGILRVPTLEVSASVYMWESGNNFYLYDPNAGSKTLSQLYLSLASQEADRLNGNVDLKAGSGVTLSQTGQTIEITSTATGSGISAYGELYRHGNAIAQSIGSTYATITALTTAGASSNTTVDTGNNRIIVNTSGTYFAIVAVSFTGNNSTVYFGGISKNGTVGNNMVFSRKIGTGTDIGAASCAGIFTLNASDWVDFRMKTPTGSSVTVEYANLSIYKIN